MTRAESIEPETDSAPFVELNQSLASRVAAISPIVDRVLRFIKVFMEEFGVTEKNEEEIEIAVHEALANAVIHGNHENPRQRVHVTCRCSTDGEVLITVRDEGKGFDAGLVPDPTEPQTLLLTRGRGLHLMRALMDEISFEKNGTLVRMRKRIKRQIGR